MNREGRICGIMLIAVSIMLLFSGCWDAKDINEKAIITTIALDYRDGEILQYCEVVNIQSAKQKGVIPTERYLIFIGRGTTLPEVLDSLDKELKEPKYVSGIDTIVFTENFAKRYLVETFNHFKSDESIRKKAMTVITKEEILKIFENAHSKGYSAGVYISGIIDSLKYRGGTFIRMTVRMIENIYSGYTGFLIPCMGIYNDSISLIGYSVVSDSIVTGFIPSTESQGVLYLKAIKPKNQYIVSYEDVNFTVEVEMQKRKVKPYYDDLEVRFDMQFEFKASILYGDKKPPYNLDKAAYNSIKEKVEKTISDEIYKAIEDAQRLYKVDYLQFDDEFRIKYPEEFESMDWSSEFANAKFEINVKADVKTRWGNDYEINYTR